ncbi:MAG: response regulator [Lacipirellulaceae bacterium]
MYNDEVTVLLVDDDDVDIRVVQRAFQKAGVANEMVIARDGIEALEQLRGTEEKPAIAGPVLVLLDLNMPRMTGLEFLQELRADAQLHHTIVFVLTTSDDQADRMAAYEQNVAGYLLKHEAGRDFLTHLAMLQKFLVTVRFPTTANAGNVPWEFQPVVQF